MGIMCIKCKKEIHPRRIKALPNTKVCVQCSTEGTHKAIITVNGEGDHTWNDIQVITNEEQKILKQINPKPKPIRFDEWGSNDDDQNLQGPFTILEED